MGRIEQHWPWDYIGQWVLEDLEVAQEVEFHPYAEIRFQGRGFLYSVTLEEAMPARAYSNQIIPTIPCTNFNNSALR